MTDWIDLVNFAITTTGITIALIGFVLSCRIKTIDSWTKRFFTIFFSIVALYAVSDLASQISLTVLGSNFGALSKAAVFLESFFSSILMPMLTLYMLRLCRQPFNCLFFKAVMSLWVVYVILLIITQFTTFIYQVTDENVYMRGPLYPILLIPPALLMLLNIPGLYVRRNLLSKKEGRALFIYLVIPLFCMVIQMFSYGILMIVLGTTISSLIMFLYIISDQIEKALRQASEIAEQQLKIRSLQMRPHFIYNTMSNIYYLCDLDPKKAQKVVGDFTTYLRNNFSAIEKTEMIPFADELEHTKAFLAVVKARYEDLIFVDYDTDYTSFRLPPLTVEPLVENAVKHGLDPESAPLHIWIRTFESEDGSTIIVENTGADFEAPEDKAPDDGAPHIGLGNVKERLRTLCGGTLSISPRDNGGTVVTVHIPSGSI